MKRYSDEARKDYFKVSNENFREAMFNLRDNSFKLWAYLCDNKDGYQFDMYPCDFCRISGLSYDTYKRSFEKLKELGYLIPHKQDSNIFMFLEKSQSDKINKIDAVVSVNEKDFEIMREKDFAG